jgi:hypothetical protein
MGRRAAATAEPTSSAQSDEDVPTVSDKSTKKKQTARVEMSGEFREILQGIRDDFQTFRQEILEQLKTRNEEVVELKAEVGMLKNTVARLEDRIDDSDAYERRDTLIFSGDAVPDTLQEENCSNIVLKLVKDKLLLTLSPGDISTAHRLGRKPVAQGPDRRRIVAKLCRRDTKREILLHAAN